MWKYKIVQGNVENTINLKKRKILDILIGMWGKGLSEFEIFTGQEIAGLVSIKNHT